MSRTLFVNPSFVNPRRRKRRSKKARGRRRGGMRVSGALTLRRNAGIASFTEANPLILSNPSKKRRRRQSNPIQIPSVKKALDSALSYGGGAALALAATTMGTSKIQHTWGRRATQFGASIVGGSMLSSKSAAMGGAFAGAMMYPLLQDLAGDLLGLGVAAGAASKEADLDALAADLEDVID